MTDDTTLFLAGLAGLAALLAVVFLVLWFRRRRPPRAESWVLIDGSNVMHWQDNLPSLTPVIAVVERLRDLGHVPGVVFDANTGWKLKGRYLHDGELARLLGLQKRQVLVAARGTPADPYVLETARQFGARIVTNDRYRDWAKAHPEVTRQGFLIRGEMRDGRLWLQGLEEGQAAR